MSNNFVFTIDLEKVNAEPFRAALCGAIQLAASTNWFALGSGHQFQAETQHNRTRSLPGAQRRSEALTIDPETLAGLTPHAILPGGRGVEVLVVNGGSSRLRIVLQADDTGTESWCAPFPPAGGVILWSEFRKECWAPGGEFYDGATPISVVGVQTYSESDTLPTAFNYCVLYLGPAM